MSSDYRDLSLFVIGEKRSHWQLLAELLSRLPNLRFLSVELNDNPEPSWSDSEEEEEEEDSDSEDEDGSVSEKEVISKAEPSKKGGLEPGEAEALVEEMKYVMEHGEDPFDRICRQERFDCRGIREALSAIGRLSNLEGFGTSVRRRSSVKLTVHNIQIQPLFSVLHPGVPATTEPHASEVLAHPWMERLVRYRGGR